MKKPNMDHIRSYVLAYYAHLSQCDQEGMNLCASAVMDALFDESVVGYEEWMLKCPLCEETTPYGSYWQTIDLIRKKVVITGDCGHSWDANPGKLTK